MVLAGKNYSFHAAGDQVADDGVRVKRSRIEDFGIFVPIAPLLIRKGIHGEVQKCIGLEPMPPSLPFGWNCSRRHLGQA